jgi:hypothetical protein
MTKTPEYFAILALNQSLFLENKEQGATVRTIKRNTNSHKQEPTTKYFALTDQRTRL